MRSLLVVLLLSGAATREPITITKARIQALQRAFTAESGTQPDAAQTQALVRQEVDDELLFREARYTGLDRRQNITDSSPQFRKLLIERMKLVLGRPDRDEPVNEDEIRAYYTRHRDRFLLPRTVSFQQVFVNSREQKGLLRASRILRLLRSSRVSAESASDPFPLGTEFSSVSAELLSRRFGERFSRAVFTLPVGHWSKPIASLLGLHLVRIVDRLDERPADLESVRIEIIQAISREHDRRRLEDALSRLRQIYPIRVESLR